MKANVRATQFLICLGMVMTLVILVGIQSVDAIPHFARRYKTSCTTCHTLIPKLNHFGLAFRANGYRIPVNDAKFIKQEDVSLGAPAWKKEWPENAVWPGAIADRVPLALRLMLDTNIFASGEKPRVNFDMPHEFAVYAGGTLGEGVSYFGEFEFEGDKIKMPLAFINFNNVLWGSPLFNVRMGRFEPVAAPFSRFYRRFTSADYNVTEFKAIPGAFNFKDPQQGVEFYGARTGPDNRGGLEWGIGVVNGSGTSKDSNSRKDLEWSLSYKFFGYGVTGPIREEVESLATSDNFVDNSIKVGVFGVVGRRTFDLAGVETDDRYDRIGVKFDAFIQRLNLYGAYMDGSNRIVATNSKFNSSAWFVEADYVLTPWIVPLVRYEKTDVTELGGIPQPQVRRIVPAVNLALRANVRLLVEGRFFIGDDDFPGSRPRNEGRVRLDFLF